MFEMRETLKHTRGIVCCALCVGVHTSMAVGQCVAPPSGLVSWWGGDGDANDIIGSNPATAIGGVSFVSGKVDQAFNFDGTNFIQIPDNPDMEPPQITIDGWIRPVFTGRGRPGQNADADVILEKFAPDFSGYLLFVAMDPDQSFLGASCVMVPFGTPGVFLNINGTFHQICGSSPIPNDGQFHHVAATYDGASMRLYLDGIEIAFEAAPGSITYTQHVDAFIGTETLVPRATKAAIDEVGIYNRALSASEIQAIFNSGSAGKCKNFDTDGDGLNDSTEVDISMGGSCPDPTIADSDGDTLSDGEEVLVLGTNPCNPDTDNDGIPDDIDPLPLDPGGTPDFIEQELRDLALFIEMIDLALIDAPNNNAGKGRRNAMSNKLTSAANAVAVGDIAGAIDQLLSLLAKLDGDPQPKDWIIDSAERDALVTEIEVLIILLEFL